MKILKDHNSAVFQNEILLTRMSDLIPKMVWLSGATGRRFFFSSKWLDFTGLSLEQEYEMDWLQSVHAEDRQCTMDRINEAFCRRQPFHIEYRLKRRDGIYREVLDSGTPQFLANGVFCGYMGTCSDIQESNRSMTEWKALPPYRASKSSAGNTDSNTNNNSPIAIWKLDCDLRVVKVNQAVYGQLGDPGADIVGKRFTEIVKSISENSLLRVLNGVATLNETCHRVVLSAQNEAIQPIWQIRAWKLIDESGEVSGICLSTIEVETDPEGSGSIEEFVAALVHDLKTPMIGADKTLEALLKGAAGVLDDGQSQILEVLQKSNQSMLSMVQNLIEVQRQESGKSLYCRQPREVFQLLRTTMLELSSLAQDRGLEIINQLPDSDIQLLIDQTSMKRVFHNLIGNALKFTNRGGTVVVSGAIGPNEISITITDSGIGIPEVDIPKLFMRYFQGSRGRRSTDGFGLGLYLCKKIIDAHGGQIIVDSKENVGSTFTIVMSRIPSH